MSNRASQLQREQVFCLCSMVTRESEIGPPPLTSIHPLSEDKASLLYVKHAFLFHAYCDDLIHQPEIR